MKISFSFISIILYTVFFFIKPCFSESFEVPSIRNFINDKAEILNPQTEQALNKILADVKNKFGIEMAVLSIKSLNSYPIEQASIKILDQWKLGSEKEDKGLLFLIVKGDRKIRIEVGQGLEGDLTDIRAKRIIDRVISPLFKVGKFNEGVFKGVQAILTSADPEILKVKYFENLSSQSKTSSKSPKKKKNNYLILFVFLLLGLNTLFGGRRGFYLGGGGFGGSGGSFGGGGGFSGGGASGDW